MFSLLYPCLLAFAELNCSLHTKCISTSFSMREMKDEFLPKTKIAS